MTMRLQKFLALSGVASRRASEKLIAEGHVTVNGKVITEMGVQVEDTDVIAVDGKPVAIQEEKHYIAYYKPIGEVTTSSDPEGRATVMDKFRDYPVRLYPGGRLDYESEGLILLTNDGDLMNNLLSSVWTYWEEVRKDMTDMGPKRPVRGEEAVLGHGKALLFAFSSVLLPG